MLKRLAILTTLGALAAIPALSQDDPPGRVARLGYLTGTVSFQPASVEDWTPAELNHPVTTGDHIWTEADGLVELQSNNASIRLAGRTNFSFLNLNDQVTQVEVTTGTLNIRLHTLAPNEGFEIDTPQLSFTLLRNGDYRIDVTPAGDATVTTVRAGDAEINIGDKATALHLGMQTRAAGAENAVLEAPHAAPPTDQFDAFCMDRDRREEAVVAARYVSRDMPGYADLDGFGGWRPHPMYGNVWFPGGLVAGWAPYRFGHFGWVEPWGWSWIDDAPWGWAPFHYGRWVVVDGAWGWVPGRIVVRPVFAPALVAFADFPVGVVVAEPVVGWFPLGFGEVYVPPFAVSVGYMASFNVGIALGAHFDVGGYHYMHRDGYMTAMRHGEFEHGRALHGDHLRVGREQMARGHFREHSGIAPHRDAVMGHRGAARGVPPRGVGERGVMAHRGVPNRPASFEHSAAARSAHPGQPMHGGERASMSRPNSNVRGPGAHGPSNAGARGPSNAGARGPSNAGARGPSNSGARGPSSPSASSRGPSSPGAGARGPSNAGARGPSNSGARGPSSPSASSRGPSSPGAGARGPSNTGSRGPSSPSAAGRSGGAPSAAGRSGGAPGGGAMGGRPGGGTPGGATGGRPVGTPGGGRPAAAPGGGGHPGGGAPSGGGHPSAPAAPQKKGK